MAQDRGVCVAVFLSAIVIMIGVLATMVLVWMDECTYFEPCHNNATCRDEFVDFTCKCATGWTGKTCEEETSLWCSSSPCSEGCMCVEDIDTYKCDCDDIYVQKSKN